MLVEKKDILKENGFEYNFERELYYNKALKKIFSIEIIMEKDPSWLKEKIKEQNEPGSQWAFYFSSEPREDVKNDIVCNLS